MRPSRTSSPSPRGGARRRVAGPPRRPGPAIPRAPPRRVRSAAAAIGPGPAGDDDGSFDPADDVPAAAPRPATTGPASPGPSAPPPGWGQESRGLAGSAAYRLAGPDPDEPEPAAPYPGDDAGDWTAGAAATAAAGTAWAASQPGRPVPTPAPGPARKPAPAPAPHASTAQAHPDQGSPTARDRQDAAGAVRPGVGGPAPLRGVPDAPDPGRPAILRGHPSPRDRGARARPRGPVHLLLRPDAARLRQERPAGRRRGRDAHALDRGQPDRPNRPSRRPRRRRSTSSSRATRSPGSPASSG